MKQLFISAILALSLVGCAEEQSQPITYNGPSLNYRVEAGVKYVGHGFNTVVYTNHLKHIGGDCYEVVAHHNSQDPHFKEGDTIVLCKVLLITQQ